MSLGRMLSRQLSLVSEGVYLTGAAGVSDTVMLQDAKVTHVLNLAQELSSLNYPELVHVRRVALRDAEDQSLLPHLEELVEHVHEVVNGGGRIAVHCVAGVSRSASVCIAYLIKHKGLSLREAHDQVKKARSVIQPNLGFWAALIDYELNVRGCNSVELLPYVAGTIPSVDSYKKEMMYRMRLGWMDHVFLNLTAHTFMLTLQMLAVFFWGYDS